MTYFTIISCAGVDIGSYAAASALDALDALAQDAGYRSWAIACELDKTNPEDYRVKGDKIYLS